MDKLMLGIAWVPLWWAFGYWTERMAQYIAMSLL